MALCAAPCSAVTFDFADFSDVSAFTLNGNASQQGARVQLTPNSANQAGSAFLTGTTAFQADYSFSSHFTFEIPAVGGSADVDGTGADGMTFAIHKSTQGANALGGNGGAMGLAAGNGVAPFVAVELDTWPTGSFDPGGSSGNHIGIDVHNVATSVAQSDPLPRFQENGVQNVWVDYHGPSQTLGVFYDTAGVKPSFAQVIANVDLGSIFSADHDLFLGFTAGTGGATESHEVVSWSFNGDVTPAQPQLMPVVLAPAPLMQDFDGGGTPFTLTQGDSTPGPEVIAGGPTGNFLRLSNNVNNNRNSIAFDQVEDGVDPTRVELNLDVRLTPATTNPADGWSILLIPTDTFGPTGAGISPTAFNAEDPGGISGTNDMFALGFGVNGSSRVRAFFDGATLGDETLNESTEINLRDSDGLFHHLQMILEENDMGDGVLNLVLTPGDGGAPVQVFSDLLIPGFDFYDYRLQMVSRTGGRTIEIDLDNININQPAIPEPMTGTLAAMGLAVLGLRMRRRAA